MMQSQAGMVSKAADNVYSVSGMYYIGYADDKIFVMPAKVYMECYNDNSLKALASNVAGAPVATALGDDMGLSVDLKAVAATLEATGLARSKSDKAALDVLRKFKDTRYTINDDCEIQWVVSFEDDKTNALKQLKDLAVTVAIGEAVN
jgi:hypothetical protein